jgi:tetratricopeptide (TPR) repeat protein
MPSYRYFFPVFFGLCCILGSSPPAATQVLSPLITQSNNTDAAKAEQLVKEAQELTEQGTGETIQQAIEKYKRARKIWQKLGEKKQEADVLLAIGTLYYFQNNSTEALINFQQGFALEEELNDRLGMAFFLNSIGNVYTNLGEGQKAIEAYNRALPIFQQEKKPESEVWLWFITV